MDSSRLLKESSLYKEANIQVDTSWLDNMCNLGDDDRELVTGLGNDSDLLRESQDEGKSEVDQIYSAERSICGDQREMNVSSIYHCHTGHFFTFSCWKYFIQFDW